MKTFGQDKTSQILDTTQRSLCIAIAEGHNYGNIRVIYLEFRTCIERKSTATLAISTGESFTAKNTGALSNQQWFGLASTLCQTQWTDYDMCGSQVKLTVFHNSSGNLAHSVRYSRKSTMERGTLSSFSWSWLIKNLMRMPRPWFQQWEAYKSMASGLPASLENRFSECLGHLISSKLCMNGALGHKPPMIYEIFKWS